MVFIPSIASDSGNVTVILKGRPFYFAQDNKEAMELWKKGDAEKLHSLLNVAERVQNYVANFENCKVEAGVVYFDGKEVHNSLTKRILDFMQKGLAWEHLAKFFNNLRKNPSYRAVTELYDFLAHNSLVITDDGCFLAYKGLTDKFLDKHTQTFDNSVGKVLEIPRNQVDDDRTHFCSYGYHCGSYDYASAFAGSDGKLVLVKVNPADVVSVPTDCDAQKCRVCKYEVMQEVENKLTEPCYTHDGNEYIPVAPEWFPDEEDDDDAEDEDDCCSECFSQWCDGECQDDEEDWEDEDEDEDDDF